METSSEGKLVDKSLLTPTPTKSLETEGAQSLLLPPKPETPLDSECCGTGCTPCVFDIHKERLKRWEKECENILNGQLSEALQNIVIRDIICPYEYSKFKVKEVSVDCLHCKILRFQKTKSDNEKLDALVNSNRFPVKLGQHVILRLQEISKPYTILDVKSDGTFTIVFKIYDTGLLTPLVDKLRIDDVVDIRGPFGKEFIYHPNKYKSLVMFAAGSGIAPFSRIIDVILENETDETRVLLCFACKNENEILILGKLKEWSRAWNFQIQYYLSHAIDLKLASGKHFGAKFNFQKIDKSVIEDICKASSNYKSDQMYLICGTKPFEKDIVNYLKCVGISEEQIKTF